MYRSIQFKSYHNERQCVECWKHDPSHKLHIFKTNQGLIRHLYQHNLTESQFTQLRELLSEYKNGSFIEFCFEKGYLA